MQRVRVKRTLVMEVTRTYEVDLTDGEYAAAREDNVVIEDVLDRFGWPESAPEEHTEFDDGSYGVDIRMEEI